MKLKPVIITATLLGCATSVHAALINYSLSSQTAVPGQTGAGVLGVSTDLWQNHVVTVDADGNTVTDQVLNDASGAATVATVSHFGFRRHNTAGQTQASGSESPLQASVYMRHLNESSSITIKNLEPGSSANLVLFATYHLSGINRGTSFTIDATTLSTTGAGASTTATLTAGQNYVQFTGLTIPPSGELDIAIAGNATNFSDFNGFQLDATIAPEPSSLLLSGVALLGLIRRKRS
ncbi:MAG: PEP-CTERM sorting domain-containing protein [Verrucomicrobiaceae bacterium]